MDMSFKPFYWDTLRGYGTVMTREDWDKFVEKHFGDMRRICSFMTDKHSLGEASFGEGARFTERPTLGEWMKKNNPGVIPEKKEEA